MDFKSEITWYNVLGIDPGNNLGISIIQVDIESNEIVNIQSASYVLDSFVFDESFNRMLDRCLKLRSIIEGIISSYRPSLCVLESSFMNTRFPKSVIQLSQYVSTIEQTIKVTDPWCKLLKLPPKDIKARCGAGGNADKNEMRSNLLKKREIASKINLNLLSEHSIDSLAMAYVGYKILQEQPYLLYSLPW